MDDKEVYGTYEIAKICHVTPATVGRWVDDGKLPSFTTAGGHHRVFKKNLISFLHQLNIPLPDIFKDSRPPRVLVVDDEAPVRKIIVRILKKLPGPIEIEEAADGFEAGRKVSNLRPDVVVLDIRLPGVDGLKILKDIRADSDLKNTKILAISGYSNEPFRTQALQFGVDDFLSKPFNLDKLKSSLIRLIGADHTEATSPQVLAAR